ncbi:transmembrane 6 superfamily member 2 [Esox lucius]|uniref:EXPERA domain-containing protein n=1 Tax=Esox lucius TaxID=8010 RepID=A0A3P8ZVM1_ESOLU|nr:transmembrane 6 superfamily member 2 [Esox lucius]
MQLPVEICVFLLSLVAPLILYTMNTVVKEPVMVLTVGAAVLYIVPYIIAFLVLNLLALQHWEDIDHLVYVFAVFSFTCLVGLTNALEQDGFISGYMGFYLKKGEPHLTAAYAIMMNYWEGIIHFLLFLLMIHRMFKGKSYRSMALIWAGSSIAHQIVFITGVVIGKYGSNVGPAFWRNLPFLLLSIWGAALLFRSPRELPTIHEDEVALEQKRSLLGRPVDLILSLLLLATMAFSVFRGIVVLDCPLDTCFTYIYQYEPYLKDPVAFPRITMLLYLFYALPLLAAFVYALWTPGCTWMLDWTMFIAGAIAQTQWCHIGGSLHSRTPFTYRIPTDQWLPVIILNGLYVATPILLAIRCRVSPAFLMPTGQTNQEDKGKTNQEKKNN